MICNNLSEMVFEFKILFHDKVAIQQVNTHELMKQEGVIPSYYLHISYGYSIEFAENRNLKY
jgi:hypothetical protein